MALIGSHPCPVTDDCGRWCQPFRAPSCSDHGIQVIHRSAQRGCSLRGTEAAHEAGPVQETSMGMKDRKAFPKVTLSLTEPGTPQEGPVRAGLPATGCLGGHEPRVTVPAWAQASCRPASSPPALTTSPRSPCPFHISEEETQAGPYLAGHQRDGSCLSWLPSPPTRVRHC